MMKTICICVLILLLNDVKAQGYLNLTSTWTESSAACGFSGTCDFLDYTRTLTGDTVLNGKTYFKVFTSGTLSTYDLFLDSIVSVEPFTEQLQYIREEQKRFYRYRTSTQNEIILADFDLTIGDTAVNTYCQSALIVARIDTVYLGNEPRRRFYFGPGNGGWPYKSLIEGVGCSAGLFTYPCHEIGIESGSSLSCFSQDGGLVVVDTSAACNTVTSIGHSPLVRNDIDVYPNPVGDYVDVLLPEQDWQRPSGIRLYNLQGRLVLSQDIYGQLGNQRVDLFDLEPGVYVLCVNAGREIWVRKVVKGR